MRGRGAGGGLRGVLGAGDELSPELPLLPFLNGLRVREPSVNPRRQAIARLLRGELGADRPDVSAVLAEQLLALVAEQCAARPAIVVIDDLQCADRDTVALWGWLARSAGEMPLLLAGLMRPVPRRDDVSALRRAADDIVRLRPAGLTASAVEDLVAVLAGSKRDDSLLQLARGPRAARCTSPSSSPRCSQRQPQRRGHRPP